MLLDSKRRDLHHTLLQKPCLQHLLDQFDEVLDRGHAQLEDGGETVQVSGVPSSEDREDILLMLPSQDSIPSRVNNKTRDQSCDPPAATVTRIS